MVSINSERIQDNFAKILEVYGSYDMTAVDLAFKLLKKTYDEYYGENGRQMVEYR